jgi:hypothetical protein
MKYLTFESIDTLNEKLQLDNGDLRMFGRIEAYSW